MYKMAVDLTLWGRPEKKQRVVDVLQSHGLSLKVTPGGVAAKAGPSYDYSHVVTHRQFLSTAEVRDDRLIF